MSLIAWVLLLSACQPAANISGHSPPATATSPHYVPGEGNQLATPQKTLTLNVFAAASLAGAFDEIGSAFSAANPGVAVTFNYAGSNQLAAQIAAGAPADVFAAANRRQMDVAVASGRVAVDAPRIFATNRLVVVVPVGEGPVRQLPDLARPGALLVLAAAEVPAGQYALEFLEKAAADPTFGAGFKEAVLENVVSYEQNVRAVLNKVALGEADAGIVYASDVVAVSDVQVIDIPARLNVPAEYPIAALNDSPHSETAAAFVAYALGPEGQATLARYGFGAASR